MPLKVRTGYRQTRKPSLEVAPTT